MQLRKLNMYNQDPHAKVTINTKTDLMPTNQKNNNCGIGHT